MLEQDLLDLARIDVAAAADHHVLGAVPQGQVAVGVEGPHVAGVQPAVAQRRLGRRRILPVPRHHHVTAADDLADLTGGAGLPSASSTATSTPDRGYPTEPSTASVASR